MGKVIKNASAQTAQIQLIKSKLEYYQIFSDALEVRTAPRQLLIE
jgi:hypothetical protein